MPRLLAKTCSHPLITCREVTLGFRCISNLLLHTITAKIRLVMYRCSTISSPVLLPRGWRLGGGESCASRLTRVHVLEFQNTICRYVNDTKLVCSFTASNEFQWPTRRAFCRGLQVVYIIPIFLYFVKPSAFHHILKPSPQPMGSELNGQSQSCSFSSNL